MLIPINDGLSLVITIEKTGHGTGKNHGFLLKYSDLVAFWLSH